MQSGISASAELQSAFQSLLTTPSHRGLLATIKDEKIEPLDFIPAGSSFLSDLSTLAPHLDPKTPLYVLLRRPDDLSSSTPNSCVAVTYVPQSSHVRLKTLFASTRLSLVRELGGEHFADSIFVTEAHELSEQGWRAYEAHDDAAQPLTREEQDLEGIKEAEASERGGTGARRGHVDSGFAIKVADEVQEALVALKNGGGDNLVQLKFDVPTETLTLDSTTSASSSSAVSSLLSPTDPRYSFYRHPSSSGILFIYTCPYKSKIRERMLYASSRQSVLNVAQSVGLTVDKKLEATDTDDVTEKAIDDEFGVQQANESPAGALGTGRGFAKPKRPGRK